MSNGNKPSDFQTNQSRKLLESHQMEIRQPYENQVNFPAKFRRMSVVWDLRPVQLVVADKDGSEKVGLLTEEGRRQ